MSNIDCDLCGTTRYPQCKTCYQPTVGPVFEAFVVKKRKPAFTRTETVNLCEVCSREIWKAIESCKTRHPLHRKVGT